MNVAYFHRKIQLSGFSAYPDGSPPQLIRISWILLYYMYTTVLDWQEKLSPWHLRRNLSVHLSLSTGRHLLGVRFITILKSNLYTAQTIVNTTENIYSHAQETTHLNPVYFNWNIFVTGGIVCRLTFRNTASKIKVGSYRWTYPRWRSDQLKCDGTRAETRFLLSAKRTSPFKSAGASVQSTAGSRGVRISGSNAVNHVPR